MRTKGESIYPELTWIERVYCEIFQLNPETEDLTEVMPPNAVQVFEEVCQWEEHGLTPREYQVMKEHWMKEKRLDDVAKQFGVTRERVRQIEAKAFRKLRHPTRKNALMYGVGFQQRAKELYEQRLEEELNRYRKMAEDDAKRIHETSSKGNDILIDELDLSVRTYNCLIRAGYRTIQDVLKIQDQSTIMKIRNLGRKSMNELIDKMRRDYDPNFAKEL